MYWESFKTFFKIGAFTFGGGYAMIPIIESEIVEKRKWISKDEFVDLIAVAQSCPGVFAINLSTFIGYKIKRVPGAICTTLATALPSFIIILLIALFFHSFQDNPVVESIFKGIRPAVVALIAVPTWNMAFVDQLLDTYPLSTAHLGNGSKSNFHYFGCWNRWISIRTVY